jgi:hypothetical protein
MKTQINLMKQSINETIANTIFDNSLHIKRLNSKCVEIDDCDYFQNHIYVNKLKHNRISIKYIVYNTRNELIAKQLRNEMQNDFFTIQNLKSLQFVDKIKIKSYQHNKFSYVVTCTITCNC